MKLTKPNKKGIALHYIALAVIAIIVVAVVAAIFAPSIFGVFIKGERQQQLEQAKSACTESCNMAKMDPNISPEVWRASDYCQTHTVGTETYTCWDAPVGVNCRFTAGDNTYWYQDDTTTDVEEVGCTAPAEETEEAETV